MNETAAGRRRRGPSRLDPTVRAVLRAFLSPTVADRYASALQPIAVADRDAALAGAVSALRARFFVLPEELAVALVEDAAWSVSDVSTLLGLPVVQVRAALRAAAESADPRFSATPPEDIDDVDDEAAAVEAMLGDLPRTRRDPLVAADEPDDEPIDVELFTRLPSRVRHPGLVDLQAQFARADRLQRRAVNGIVIALLLMVAAAIATAQPSGEPDVDDDDTVIVTPTPPPSPSPSPSVTAPSPTAEPTPTASPSAEAGPTVGPPLLAEGRFVASVDPATGEPGPTLDPATVDDDPRLWLRFEQLPEGETLLSLTFTAPSGESTFRPVLVRDRTPLVSVRLPDELGRDPGRYAVRIEADGMDTELVELQLVPDGTAAG